MSAQVFESALRSAVEEQNSGDEFDIELTNESERSFYAVSSPNVTSEGKSAVAAENDNDAAVATAVVAQEEPSPLMKLFNFAWFGFVDPYVRGAVIGLGLVSVHALLARYYYPTRR
eukprot:TRINITY_DN425_c0_g1_i2.p1 TRINITY_DN425_c0_g1~~TRINITY_DN425_c0_g1_i2.p1  ORF type:complete len:130 (-),score=34.08 TRINITY_DN425_c0_g1_i2:58-405(-)